MGKEGKKESVPVEYSESFECQALRELLNTGDSVPTVAKRLGIGVTTLYRWIRIFGIELPKDYYKRTMNKN